MILIIIIIILIMIIIIIIIIIIIKIIMIIMNKVPRDGQHKARSNRGIETKGRNS